MLPKPRIRTDLGEIRVGSPHYWAPNRGGVKIIRSFQAISRSIAETVQDRDVVIMEG